MPFTPGDISAVEALGNSLGSSNTSASILYYIDDNGILDSVQAGQKTGTANNTQYNLNKLVQVLANGNKNPVKPKSQFLDAVAYDQGGTHQVRIYFIGDRNNNDSTVKYDNQLLELVNNNGGAGDWTPGKLNNLGLKVTSNTGITANVAYGSGNLKVFYHDADANALRVAWVTLGETAWTSDDLTATPGFT